MNILNVSPLYYPSPGGAECYLKEVSERLSARGHRVTVLTTNASSHRDFLKPTNGSLPECETLNGVRVIRIRTTDDLMIKILEAWTHLKGGYRSLSCLIAPEGLEMLFTVRPRNFAVLRSVLGSTMDLVVSWNWVLSSAYHAYLARRLKRFPLVGVPLFHTEENWAKRAIYDHMLRACDGLIVNTLHEKDYIKSRVPGTNRIAVVGAGVNPESFARADGSSFRRRHMLGTGPLVGFVGRICTGKGVDTLLESMRLVWKWNKEVRLVLAGYLSYDTLPADHFLHSLAEHEQQRILFLPQFPENEKANLYDAIDVFVLPSVAESFGIAYLEAWMRRKPVIGSRIPSTKCVIDDGLDGLLVDPKDPCELAQGIRTLLAEPERRSQMGEQGYAKTVKNFTWDVVSEKLETFFSDLVGPTSAPASSR